MFTDLRGLISVTQWPSTPGEAVVAPEGCGMATTLPPLPGAEREASEYGDGPASPDAFLTGVRATARARSLFKKRRELRSLWW